MGFLRRKGISPFGKAAAWPYLLGRFIAEFLGIITFFMPRSTPAFILTRLFTIVVTALSMIFLYERASKARYVSLAVFCSGVWLAFYNSENIEIELMQPVYGDSDWTHYEGRRRVDFEMHSVEYSGAVQHTSKKSGRLSMTSV